MEEQFMNFRYKVSSVIPFTLPEKNMSAMVSEVPQSTLVVSPAAAASEADISPALLIKSSATNGVTEDDAILGAEVSLVNGNSTSKDSIGVNGAATVDEEASAASIMDVDKCAAKENSLTDDNNSNHSSKSLNIQTKMNELSSSSNDSKINFNNKDEVSKDVADESPITQAGPLVFNSSTSRDGLMMEHSNSSHYLTGWSSSDSGDALKSKSVPSLSSEEQQQPKNDSEGCARASFGLSTSSVSLNSENKQENPPPLQFSGLISELSNQTSDTSCSLPSSGKSSPLPSPPPRDSTCSPLSSSHNSPNPIPTQDVSECNSEMATTVTTMTLPAVTEPSKPSPSPMINIPVGVVKEFMSSSKAKANKDENNKDKSQMSDLSNDFSSMFDDDSKENSNPLQEAKSAIEEKLLNGSVTIAPVVEGASKARTNGSDEHSNDVVERMEVEVTSTSIKTEEKTTLTNTTPTLLDPLTDVTLTSVSALSSIAVTPVSTSDVPPQSSDITELQPMRKSSTISTTLPSVSITTTDGTNKTTDINALKRTIDVEAENDNSKKIKLSNEPTTKKQFSETAIEEEVQRIRKVATRLHKMKKKDLENMVLELFMSKLLHDHELGKYKSLCEKLETTLESSRKKAAQFHKEVEDLRKVTKRLREEHQARKDHVFNPVKIKRSVGIQAAPHIIQKGIAAATSTSSLSPSSTSFTNSTPKQSRYSTSTNSNGFQTSITQSTTQSSLFQSTTAPSTPVSTSTGLATPHNGQQMSYLSSSAGNATVAARTNVNNRVSFGSPFTNSVGSSMNKQMVTFPSSLPNNNSRLTSTVATQKSNSGSSGVIDLTDEEENRMASTKLPSTLLKSGNNQTSGFVTLPQSPAGAQYVLMPGSAGNTTAVMVASVGNSTGTGNLQNTVGGARLLVSAIPTSVVKTSTTTLAMTQQQPSHPAPLPRTPPQQVVGGAKQLPPKPTLKLSHKENSIVLSWTMAKTVEHEAIASYQLYAYQEGTQPPSPALWKKVGSVKALELPMACTLTQFMPGHRYHFAVRAVDTKSRLGPFSDPRSINLEK